MSTATGLDRAVEYVQKLEAFRAAFEKADKGCQTSKDSVQIESGRKFDKVYVQTWHGGKPLQRLGRYMVDRNSWRIMGIKSWSQVNERRVYGTLDTVDQYDWSAYYGVPIAGTEAEKLHNERESVLASQFKPRGRPRLKPKQP